MLAGENRALHAGGFEGGDDGAGIECGGMKERGIFVAVAPFLIGESVHRKVKEGAEFHFMPMKLRFGGAGSKGRWSGNGRL